MKIFVVGKNSVLVFVFAVALIAGVIMANKDIGADIMLAFATKRDLPIYSVDTDEKKLSISFDAAWGNEDTNDLIKILNDYNVKTTFFVVGEWVDKYPESVKALFDAGHEVMNHSDTHPHMTKISVEKMKQQVKACDDKIEKITGVRPFLFRPPYGDYNDSVVSTLRDMGHYTIQWDVETINTKIKHFSAVAKLMETERPASTKRTLTLAINKVLEKDVVC